MESPKSETAPTNGKRRRLLLIAGAVFIVAGLSYGAYWAKYLRHFERTDDAYVQGNLVQITPQVAGTVVAVNADDTDFVKAGQTLVTLDRADAQVALEQAQAALAQTVREVRGLYVTNSTWAANIAQREADVTRANADLARAQDDLARRESLANTGAVSGEEMNHAQTGVSNARAALAAAQAALAAARQQLATNQSLTEGTSIEKHPNVERTAAKVREAYLAYVRTELPSPVSGYVAKRTVQLGQRVAAGTPLMSIVPLDEVWVDANFKEVQLRRMRIGEPVTMTADVYGSSVKYHGRVIGFSAGTGSAFATLPAQNATGNWIKIVQRLPVRIALDPKELEAHPLRIGLSMDVDADTRDDSGTQLGAAVNTTYHTDVFAKYGEEADVEIAKIIGQNEMTAQAKTAQPAARKVAMGS